MIDGLIKPLPQLWRRSNAEPARPPILRPHARHPRRRPIADPIRAAMRNQVYDPVSNLPLYDPVNVLPASDCPSPPPPTTCPTASTITLTFSGATMTWCAYMQGIFCARDGVACPTVNPLQLASVGSVFVVSGTLNQAFTLTQNPSLATSRGVDAAYSYLEWPASSLQFGFNGNCPAQAGSCIDQSTSGFTFGPHTYTMTPHEFWMFVTCSFDSVHNTYGFEVQAGYMTCSDGSLMGTRCSNNAGVFFTMFIGAASRSTPLSAGSPFVVPNTILTPSSAFAPPTGCAGSRPTANNYGAAGGQATISL